MTDRIISLDAAIPLAFEGVEQSLEEIVDGPVTLWQKEDKTWMVTAPRADFGNFASFEFRPSLQCSGIAVPFHSKVDVHWRGKGIASILHTMRIDAARRASMKLMVATTRLSNDAQMHIMNKNDWNPVSTFDNPRSGHTVVLWVKEL